ncbi:ribosome biogenesis protein ERB1 [Thelephora ganbajun]|uniref:Ribosome biogenesis protein ERB1 n=1 Tax=Thelephora ganbajun TaxID=370292 RepID=A0ACB6ZJR4_THEGA|nr:ribosome biogenesis protein ERB1 [Thelephora ganbajun]
MASVSNLRKRKSSAPGQAPKDEQLLPVSALEMLSEDEHDEEPESDDGNYEEFPEIDAASDTEEEEDDDDDDDDDDDEGEEGEEEADYSSDASGSEKKLSIFPKAKVVISDITGEPKKVYPEIEPDYDSDSSTEDAPNRIGNIPMHWYDDMPHIGYDVDGKKLLRPAVGDELDKFLKTQEDPTTWMSVLDNNTQAEKQLSPEELDLIRRLYQNENPDAGYDPYEPMVEWFTGKGKEEIMPLSAAPEPKRRWIPSKWEKQKVMKIVRAIRQGRIVPSKPKTSSTEPRFYAVWSDPIPSLHPPPLPAPKPRPPTHAESYNPPEEYLPTEEERKEWEATDKEDRERDYLPQKHSALRLVPAYDQFIQQRFSRQLDLYLAPRIQRTRLRIDPNSLIPKLPSPSSLKPFPTYKSLDFSHGASRVCCISASPDGAWVLSASESGVISLWEAIIGREVKKWNASGKVGSISWCQNPESYYFIVGLEDRLEFFIPPNLPSSLHTFTKNLLAPATLPPQPATPSPLKWISSSDPEKPVLVVANLSGLTKQIAWHARGDYFATVSSDGGVWIHQVTKRHSQSPFKKIKGTVQIVLFHPKKPNFFVATQTYVRLYNLSEQKLIKTLMPGIKWISSMSVHPSGDHIIVGGYDRKLCWFDLELSNKPYKILRYHTRAIRSLHFHPTYPLFASSSDDGTIQIFHARIYHDLMTDPLIVPLKILRGHIVKDGLGVLQVEWISRQPWLLSAGADGKIDLWCS